MHETATALPICHTASARLGVIQSFKINNTNCFSYKVRNNHFWQGLLEEWSQKDYLNCIEHLMHVNSETVSKQAQKAKFTGYANVILWILYYFSFTDMEFWFDATGTLDFTGLIFLVNK